MHPCQSWDFFVGVMIPVKCMQRELLCTSSCAHMKENCIKHWTFWYNSQNFWKLFLKPLWNNRKFKTYETVQNVEYCQSTLHFKIGAVVLAFQNTYASRLLFTIVIVWFQSFSRIIPLYFLLNKTLLFKTLINTLFLNNKTPFYLEAIQCFIL